MIIRKSLFIIFCLVFNTQILVSKEKTKINGSWNFKYLEIQNQKRIWEIESDTINYDYLNIHFPKTGHLDYLIEGSCFMEAGSYKLTSNILSLKADSAMVLEHDFNTDFRKNINLVIDLLYGDLNYSITDDTLLRICRKDSCFVFYKFSEE